LWIADFGLKKGRSLPYPPEKRNGFGVLWCFWRKQRFHGAPGCGEGRFRAFAVAVEMGVAFCGPIEGLLDNGLPGRARGRFEGLLEGGIGGGEVVGVVELFAAGDVVESIVRFGILGFGR
jgi:hypothetical protein